MEDEYTEEQMAMIINHYMDTNYREVEANVASSRQARDVRAIVKKFIDSGNVKSLFLAWTASGKLDAIFEALKKNPDYLKLQQH